MGLAALSVHHFQQSFGLATSSAAFSFPSAKKSRRTGMLSNSTF
jgi:hypothetical protein